MQAAGHHVRGAVRGWHCGRLQRLQATQLAPLINPGTRSAYHSNGPALPQPGEACLNRRVLLTGGTSGIGLAVAQRLVQESASLVSILTRDESRGETALKAIREGTGSNDVPVSVLKADVTSAAAMSEVVGAAMRDMKCDAVISCAGITQSSSILRLDEDEISRIVSTNLTSNIHLGKQFLKHYHRQSLHATRSRKPEPATTSVSQQATTPPSHVFIAVSSLLANTAGEGASVYAASKAGLNAFVRALCLEGSTIHRKDPARIPPFRANVVLPGYVDTPMLKDFAPSHVEKLHHAIPLGRFATADEVADAVVFLIANEYANNTVLNLDGGLSAT